MPNVKNKHLLFVTLDWGEHLTIWKPLHYCNGQVKDEEIDGACGMHGRMGETRNAAQLFSLKTFLSYTTQIQMFSFNKIATSSESHVVCFL
jgi:hypothetical protein